MKRFIVGLVSLLVATAALGATTYSYTGPLFTSANPPYTLSMRITGSFTTAVPLPPNMPMTAIGPSGNGLALSWSFTDGLNTFTNANSDEFGDAFGDSRRFRVATDGNGFINDWEIVLENHKSPWAVNEGGLNVLNTEKFAGLEAGTNGWTCLGISAQAHCLASLPNSPPQVGSVTALGTWTGGSAPVIAVPTLTAWGIWLLAVLMALGVLYSTQRRRS